MRTYDVAKRKHVGDEQERTKHLGQRGGGGGAVVDADELLSVCEI